MSYTGHVEKGVVVFDGPLKPPEGAAVLVQEVKDRQSRPVGAGLARLAGKLKGLPSDYAQRHEEYRRQRGPS